MIVRITLWPDQDLDVDQREHDNLRMLGLLIESPAEPAPAPAEPSRPRRRARG